MRLDPWVFLLNLLDLSATPMTPFWYPPRPEQIRSPLLWVAGGADAAFPEPVSRRSAAHYGADYVVAEGAGHDLMLERSSAETARQIHTWLAARVA